jgi:transposase-like protein
MDDGAAAMANPASLWLFDHTRSHIDLNTHERIRQVFFHGQSKPHGTNFTTMKYMYHLKQIPSEAQTKKYLCRIIFGKNLFCLECRSRSIVTYEQRHRCHRCRTKLTLLSHTWLKGMKLSYQKFWIVLWCWTTEIPIKQCMALTELSDEAVRRWYAHFRAHLPHESHILERIVQLDESFFKTMTLMMAKQKGTRKRAYEIIPGTHPQRQHAAILPVPESQTTLKTLD